MLKSPIKETGITCFRKNNPAILPVLEKISLIVALLCLLFGVYKFIHSKRSTPEPAAALEKVIQSNTADMPQSNTTLTASSPVEVLTISEEIPEEAPIQEREPFPAESYRLDGIAKGSRGYMVMINNTPLCEGQALDEVKVEKITDYFAEVSFKGNTYQLRPGTQSREILNKPD